MTQYAGHAVKLSTRAPITLRSTIYWVHPGKLGAPDLAVQAYELALMIDPSNAAALSNLAPAFPAWNGMKTH